MATHSMFFPGESQGRGSLVGSRLWGRTESDTTEATQQQQNNFVLMCQRPCPGVCLCAGVSVHVCAHAWVPPCVPMCECPLACLHVCSCLSARVRASMFAHACMPACVPPCVPMCTGPHVCPGVHVHACMPTYVPMHACPCACPSACMPTWVPICVSSHLCH